MSGSVNRVILVGNLGRDPEIRATQSGRLANLSLATSETWTDKNSGERQERTEWHRVVIFDERLVEVAEKYLRKGSKIYLEGQLQTRKWTDQQGNERYSTEVVLQRYRSVLTMLDSKPQSGIIPRSTTRIINSGTDGLVKPESQGGSDADLDDDIPW